MSSNEFNDLLKKIEHMAVLARQHAPICEENITSAYLYGAAWMCETIATELRGMAMMEGLTEGRIVHYVLPNGDHRPAIVVNCWRHVPNYVETGTVNLQVFTDGTNDGELYTAGISWATSVRYSADPKPHTWHWIEKA